MATKKGSEVLVPNLGLYLGTPKLSVPPQGLSEGRNFRVTQGHLSNVDLGWTRFKSFTLNGPVLLIDDFFPISQGLPEQLIFATPTDLYLYLPHSGGVRFLTPIYSTGYASVSGTTVTGVGTDWNNPIYNIKTGDQIAFGGYFITDPAFPWHTIQSITGAGGITLTASAGTIPAGNYTIRRLFSGGVSTIWSTDVFQDGAGGTDMWWATNGVDPIVMWNGLDWSVKTEGSGLSLPFKAKVVTVYKNMLIFLNLIEGGTLLPTTMANSAPGDPLNFSTGLAGEYKIHSGADEITAAEILGDSLIVYSNLHITQALFVGDVTVFLFRAVRSVAGGPASPNAVANMGNYHEFLAADTMYAFDGVTVKDINNHVWREVISKLDPERNNRIYNHFDIERGDLIWSIPQVTDPPAGVIITAPAFAWTEHYLETVARLVPTPHSVRDFPFLSTGEYFQQSGITWDTLAQPWNTLLFRWSDLSLFNAQSTHLAGDVNGKVFSFNGALQQTADGISLPSYVRFGKRALADGQVRGLLARIYPFVLSHANALTVTSFLSDHPSGLPTITQMDTFDQNLTEGNHFVTPYRRGRFVELQFGTAGLPWELEGYDVKIKSGGTR